MSAITARTPTDQPRAWADQLAADPATAASRDRERLLRTVGILDRLVAFDTTSARSNRELIDWAANQLSDLGISVHVQHGDEPGKANLFATIGDDSRGGVMLSGHSDVVPVAGESWLSDPFRLTLRDGALYGRGSADMKAWIACCLAMAPRWRRTPLSTPVHLALSYNEETNMHGMKQLARHLGAAPVRPTSAIIGEPTLMRLVVANKGAAIWNVRIRGKAVHSSFRHLGVSAVEVAAELIVFLGQLQKQHAAAARHDGFEFPHTSIQVGKIAGGTAHNITARDCEFVFEVRSLPGTTAADVLAQVRHHVDAVLLPPLKAISDECDIRIEEIADTPGLDESGNRYLAQVLMPLSGCSAVSRVSFGTEGGILQSIGIPTVIMGPGDIGVAHRPDEHVAIEQLDRCLSFLDVLTERLVAGTWPPPAGR